MDTGEPVCAHRAADSRDPWSSLQSARRWLKDEAALVTVLLFVTLALKMLVIARGNVPTALAILQSASITTVIVGSFISATPMVVFGVLAWTVSRSHLADIRSPIAILVAVTLVVGLYVPPWIVVVSGVGVGALLRLTGSQRNTPLARAARWPVLVIAVVAALFSVWVFLDALWVPHEAVRTTHGGTIVGYVLDSGGDWTSVLVSERRVVVHVRTEHITAREICTLQAHQHSLFSNEAPSVWTLLGRAVPRISHGQPTFCPTPTRRSVASAMVDAESRGRAEPAETGSGESGHGHFQRNGGVIGPDWTTRPAPRPPRHRCRVAVATRGVGVLAPALPAASLLASVPAAR